MPSTSTYIRGIALAAALALQAGCSDRGPHSHATSPEQASGTVANAGEISEKFVPHRPESDREAEEKRAEVIWIEGVVERFVPGSGPLQGASVCIDSECAVSDPEGKFKLPLAEKMSEIRVTAHGHVPTVVPVDRSTDGSVRLQLLARDEVAAFAELADGRFDAKRGAIFVQLHDADGFGVPDVWLTIRDFAALGPVYTAEGVVPRRGLRASTPSGLGAFLELPAGEQEVGIRAPTRACELMHLSKDDEGLYEVPALAGTITWLHARCESDQRAASID